MKPSNTFLAACLAYFMSLALIFFVGCTPGASPPVPSAPSAPSSSPSPVVSSSGAQPSGPRPESPRGGGTLAVAMAVGPEHLDLQQGTGIDLAVMVAQAYNNLLYYDPATGSKLVGELAESWEGSSDGLTHTFKLRDGVKFHNGAPLKVEDGVFSLDRVKSPPKGVISNQVSSLAPVDKISVAGNNTIKVEMKYASAPFVAALALDYIPIYSTAYIEKYGDMKTTVMGTGPFKLKSYTPGVSLELVKNDEYWVKGRPYLDGINFLVLKDKATRLAALRTGQAQLSDRAFAALTPTDVATLKKDVPGMRLISSPTVLGPWFFMNIRSVPLKDTRVRQAISLAVDRQAAIQVIAEGEGAIGNYFPYQGWGIPREELLKMPGYQQPKDRDIATAKKLLADAGYASGFTVQLAVPNREVTKTAAVFMTEQLSRIGITTTVQILEDALFFDKGRKAQHEAIIFTPGTVIADPDYMGRYFAPRQPFNFSGNDDDPKINELWSRQLREVDEKSRKATIEELERYLLTEAVPAVPLVWPATYIAVSPQVRGFVAGVTDYSNNRHQETWLAP